MSKHLAVLEAANLVTTVWRGREKLHYHNAAPISDIPTAGSTTSTADESPLWRGSKEHWRHPFMGRPEFVYVTYIRTTPERLWRALTDPEFTARYWGRTYDTDWRKGSLYGVTQSGVGSMTPSR